jgi:Uma2 family endonuclease
MTFEEAARLDPDLSPGELDDGAWVPVTRSTWRHGTLVGNAYSALREYARTHPGWSVSVGDPGTKLGHSPDILRGPDVGVVAKEREPTGKGAEGWLEGAPDFVVEVAGDAQAPSLLAKKALEYLAAGAKMVCIIDPEPERVMIYEPPNRVRILGRDEVLDAGEVLPGFSCPVAQLFE